MGLGSNSRYCDYFNTLEIRLMTDYEIEKQIRQMLDKYQQSDFTKSEVRRCLAEVFSRRLKDYFLKKSINQTK